MAFIRNHWYPAAWAHEVGRTPLARTMLGEKVALYRTEDGPPVALEDRCCHKFLPLSMGEIVGDTLRCGYHGMTYDRSGACVRIPGQASIPPTARVHSYPATEHLGLIWLWMGEPALADESMLYPLPQYDDPAWGLNTGPYTYVEANYQHLTDNLLDPAHVSFVHQTTLGSPAGEDIPVETRQEGDRVIVSRWTLDAEPVPIFQKFADFEGHVDRWQYYYFTPPSIAVVDFGSGPVGMDQSDAGRDASVRIYSCHFIAPETERSSHYFWMQLRNFAPDDATSAEITEQFILAFEEDKAILAAVQKSEDEGPARAPVKLAIDNGPTRSRRIVEKKIRAEQTAQAAE